MASIDCLILHGRISMSLSAHGSVVDTDNLVSTHPRPGWAEQDVKQRYGSICEDLSTFTSTSHIKTTLHINGATGCFSVFDCVHNDGSLPRLWLQRSLRHKRA